MCRRHEVIAFALWSCVWNVAFSQEENQTMKVFLACLLSLGFD